MENKSSMRGARAGFLPREQQRQRAEVQRQEVFGKQKEPHRMAD